jgi:hypothetical protein
MHTLDCLDGYFFMSRLIASGFLTWKFREPKVAHGALASCMQPQIFRKACNVKELNIGHAPHLVFIQEILPMWKLSSTKCVN